MERSSSASDIRILLESIKSSDVVESRIELLAKLRDLDFLAEKSELASIVDCLIMVWEDFTCLDVSLCMLNKAILQLAAKFVNLDLSGSLIQFLSLGTKASSWCGKHLKMTLMSTEESQEEEHSIIFFQLLSEFMNLSVACMMVLTKYPVSTENASMAIVERFILEQLNLTKDILSDVKRIKSLSCEVLKVVHTIIDSVVNLCKEYAVVLNWGCDTRPERDGSTVDSDKFNVTNHVINITKCTLEKLCELGVLAANDGGSLVNILNVSWKGVVTLLQQVKILNEIVRVQDIITTLISLANCPLRCAAEAWSSTLAETISVSEARRTFLPVKFYLINAVKISSLYPSQAYMVYKEIALCVLRSSTFKIFLSREESLNCASEVFSELLEKTLVDLLSSLLNSSKVIQELKFELLDWVFPDSCVLNPIHGALNGCYQPTSLADIFSVNCEVVHETRILSLGRLAVFHNFLRFSVGLDEAVKFRIARKLEWLLDVLTGEEIYSYILNLQIPVMYGSGKTTELVWQPLVSALSQALKTFMIAAVSSSLAWVELEAFLIKNLFHPHFLCCEIVLELWCFLVRYAEKDVVSGIIDKLCSTIKLLESSESFLIPGSPLRKMARIICLLLKNGTPSLAVHVYSSVVGDNRRKMSTVLYVALLLEGFPLNSLPDNLKSIAKQNIITDYFNFIGSFDDTVSNASGSNAFGIPVHALSASLHARQVSLSDVDAKTLKLLVSILRNIKNPEVKLIKEQYHKLLSETLGIVSNMKHLYESDAIEDAILELQNLFISGPVASDAQLGPCKPYLALFMGGLGDMTMSESDDCAKSAAVWELFHMLLKERHWALAHFSIAAFGYFAARTSCNQLWRFVPQDAALSYDLISGNESNEERFMLQLKAFLEKEMALLAVTPSLEQVEALMKEGVLLKEMVEKIANLYPESVECKYPETDVNSQSNKRIKLLDGINKGVELLQSGLRVIGDGLSHWPQNQNESSELHDQFMTHFSLLEDVISQLTSLAGNGQVG